MMMMMMMIMVVPMTVGNPDGDDCHEVVAPTKSTVLSSAKRQLMSKGIVSTGGGDDLHAKTI